MKICQSERCIIYLLILILKLGDNMLSIIFSIIAGAAMSLQGVINTRLSEKIGLYESNLFVQGTAFILSLLALFILGKGNFSALLETKKLYWLGGLFGLIITITVMLGIKGLSPTVSISIILIAQLIVAALIDCLGLFDTKKVVFHWSKLIGLALMIAGVLVFKIQLKK